jgi:F1F0 ATPase subunit 2
MTPFLALPLVAQLAIGLVAGGLTGLLHFASLGRNLDLFLSGRAGTAIALQLGRLALSVGVLVLLLKALGLPALLAGALGLLLARQWVIRGQKRAIEAANARASS